MNALTLRLFFAPIMFSTIALTAQGLIEAIKDGKTTLVAEMLTVRSDTHITSEMTAGSIHAIRQDIINSCDEAGMAPLHYAVLHKHSDIVETLLRHGAQVNIKNAFNMTPLHYAAALSQDVIVTMLLAAGADVSAVDEDGMTPLHYAISAEHESICTQLLEAGADMVHKNDAGETPLIMAAQKGLLPLVMLLVEFKADLHAHNNHKHTARELAARWGHIEVKNFLDKALITLSSEYLWLLIKRGIVVSFTGAAAFGIYYFIKKIPCLFSINNKPIGGN